MISGAPAAGLRNGKKNAVTAARNLELLQCSRYSKAFAIIVNRIYGRTILYVADTDLIAYFDGEPAFMFDLELGQYRLLRDSLDEYIERIMNEED